MDALVTITPEAQELIAFSLTFLATAEAVVITSEEEAQAAVEQTRKIKECAKTLDETRKGYTKPLDDQKALLMDTFRPAVDSLELAEKKLKGALATWAAELQRRAAEALKEQQRLETLERERQQKEQDSASELLRQADALAAAGDIAGAEALEEQAAQVQEVAAPIFVPATVLPTKTKGFSARVTWKCKVVNPALLDRAYLMPNHSVLDALAATAKGVGPAPAGCEWTSTSSGSIR